LIRSWGEAGSKPGQFSHPTRVAIGTDGVVYVADADSARIEEFTADGAFIRQWGTEGTGPGQFEEPTGVAVGPTGEVLVSDYSPSVQKFTADGQFIARWTPATLHAKLDFPNGLAVGGDGITYVADLYDLMYDLSPEGSVLLHWGGERELGEGRFSDLQSIAIDQNETLYILDAGSHDVIEKWGFPPALRDVQPRNARAEGGDTIELQGTRLGETTSVRFGDTAAPSFEVRSPTTILAVAPPGTGTVPVSVIAPAGSSTESENAEVTYIPAEPAPTIKKISLRHLSPDGGDTVTITGNNLLGATDVMFGSKQATGLSDLSSTTLTITAPAASAGQLPVAVTTPYGTSAPSAKASVIYGPPRIDRVDPGTGPRSGQNTVTIEGSGFAPGAGNTTFKFGKQTPVQADCLTIAKCTADAPAASRPGAVAVIAAVGRSKSKRSSAALYTYE
jgi:IPT/TIG domain-containing protein